MKKALLVGFASFAISLNAFSAVKCFQEQRAVEDAFKAHTANTNETEAYGLQTGNFLMAIAVELMAQPNARVGGYGYGVKTNAQTTIDSFEFLATKSNASEKVVTETLRALQDCLINN
ncbi:MAG: hypothetical protein WC635_09350 [Bacteriovorax sp.]